MDSDWWRMVTVYKQVVPEADGLAGDVVGVVELLVEPRFLGDS